MVPRYRSWYLLLSTLIAALLMAIAMAIHKRGPGDWALLGVLALILAFILVAVSPIGFALRRLRRRTKSGSSRTLGDYAILLLSVLLSFVISFVVPIAILWWIIVVD